MIYQGKQKIWSEYQKEIPDDHWFYVRSCIRQNFFPGAEKMFLEQNYGSRVPATHPSISLRRDSRTASGISPHPRYSLSSSA